MPLAERLKASTRELHACAERSGVMGALLGRGVGRAEYLALLVNLRALYAALEAALAHWPPPAMSPMLGALRRLPAIDDDLQHLATPPLPPLEMATHAYVQRLERIDGASAHRLVAHAYVRYLGDLHGGQMLGARVRQWLGLQPGDGTRFYAFGDEAQVRQLRDDFRRALALQVLTPSESDEVVAEAVWAFEAHCRMFEQIESRFRP